MWGSNCSTHPKYHELHSTAGNTTSAMALLRPAWLSANGSARSRCAPAGNVATLVSDAPKGMFSLGLGVDRPAVAIEDWPEIAFAQLERGDNHRGQRDHEDDAEHDKRHLPRSEVGQRGEDDAERRGQ